MAGLLDGFSDFVKTPEGQGLLSAAFGGLAGARRGAPLNSLGIAGIAGLQGYGGALDREKQAAEAAQMQKYREMQQQQMQMQIEAARRNQEQESTISAGIGQFFKPGQAALPPLMGDPSTGILPSNGRAPVAPSFDATGASSFLAKNGDYKGAFEVMDKFKPTPVKLKNVEQMKDPQTGQLVNVAMYENGETKVLPFGVKPDIQILGMGDRQEVVDKNSVQGGQSFRMGQSPDSKASNAVAWANNSLSRERLNFDKAGGADGGKPPTGYRWKMDKSGLEAIPGGPADIKAGELGAKMDAKKQSSIASAQNVRTAITEAKDLTGNNTAGIGSWLSALPATDARNLSAKLETIKGNLGFDRLQQMRDQSPTGGALGAVAVQELTALQSTVASLDQGQSPAQLRAALNKIDKHYENWQAVMRGENPYGKSAPKPGEMGSGSFNGGSEAMNAADAILRGGN